MTETLHDVSAPAAPPDSSPALENAAVAHCCQVWESTRRQALNQGNSNVQSCCHKAFRIAMPPLTETRTSATSLLVSPTACL